MRYRPSPQLRKTALGATALVALAGMNAPAALGFASSAYHQFRINQPEYKQRYGQWDLVDVPERYRINAIHAALLHTGKVLLIAGSGNDEENFRAGTFQSVLWDPVRNTFKEIDTPKDMFCAGHAQLPGGRLLVAGGTARYEKLKGDVTRAGGAMIIKNEDPDQPRLFPKGTLFRGSKGTTYRSLFPVLVPRATKSVEIQRFTTGTKKKRKQQTRQIVTVTANQARVYVEAVRQGVRGITNTADQYKIVGLRGKDRDNFYGLATKLGLDKKDFQGLREAYEFDPVAERYFRVDPMAEARWYPTLVTLDDDKVMAVSGLDDIGEIIPGKNEIYDPATRKWSAGPTRYFPTYPALFLTKGGDLFYSGSNSGYGPAEQGRQPGIWNPKTNKFRPVHGLTDPELTETSASVLLPPAQDRKVMIFGGGGVGESPRSSARTATVDLSQREPRYTDGPDLPARARYLNAVLAPDDTVFTTGGSRNYRGKGGSDILRAQWYDPKKDTFRTAAAPAVGRNYHSEALLLPDGRIAVLGSDPLFADLKNTQAGAFEQRIEVYTPPYLQGDARPELGAGPREVARGGTATFRAQFPSTVRAARLMRPSAVTHATDVEQRSIALAVARHEAAGTVTLTVPADPALVPRGWYMLFVTDGRGIPSTATWVHVR